MRRLGRFSIVVVMVVFVLLSIPMAVLATSFGINILGPGINLTILDNAAGDLDSAVNVILVSAHGTGFTVNIDTALTNSPGSSGGGVVDLGWQVVAGTGGTLTITASATDFVVPAAGIGSSLTSSFGGTITAGGTITGQQWDNPSNLLFATTGFTPGVQGPFSTSSFSNTATVGFNSVTPYSLTDQVVITLGSGGQTSGDINSTTSVPEPISLILLGSGLVGAGLYRRLRKPRG